MSPDPPQPAGAGAPAKREGVDYSDRHTAAEVKAMGAEFAIRYLSPNTKNHPTKQLTTKERRALHRLGIAVGFVWESTASRATAGHQAGVDDANAAKAHLKALGAPDDSVVYFAVDFDTAGNPGQVDEYFRGVTETFGKANTGVYGGYEAVEHLHEQKQIPWMWQTASWSHKKWYSAAQIQQYQIDNPAGWDLDRTTVAAAGLWEPEGSPNRRVEGQVVDPKGNGIADLAVGVFRQDVHGDRLMINTFSFKDEDFYGYARTLPDGKFVIGYDGGVDDIVIRVFDTIGRQLGPDDGPYQDVKAPLVLPKAIQIGDAELKGRVSTGGAFKQMVGSNFVEPLIDNDVAWKAIYDEVGKAQTSIDWMLFFLDVGRVFLTFDDETPDVGVPTTGGRLEDTLKTVAGKGVKVRLACNQLTAGALDLPWPATTAEQVAKAMKGVSNVEVRALRTPASAPIHTKFVVIDNKVAYLIGSPFVSDYFDGKAHKIADPRHGDFSSCIDSRAIVVPTHDVSLRLRGPAIGQLNETFALHWNTAKPDATPEPPAPAPAPPAGGNVSLQVVRSLAGNGRYKTSPHGEKTVLESYLRAIAVATKYVYLENQYFTNEVIADALVRRLRAHKTLCVIFLTNNKVDIPGYPTLHRQTVRRVLDALTAQQRKRIGFFCSWSHEPGAAASDPTEICRNYIHSKVGIVDDEWITVGSANLDGASLDYSQVPYTLGFWSWLFGLQPKGNLHENRETEVNLTLFDQAAGGPAAAIAKDARKRLWAEHLGLANPADAALENPPAGGNWLTLWQRRAEAKLDALKASPIAVNAAKVLAYPPKPGTTHAPKKAASAGGFLELAGVKLADLRVWEHYRRFDWTKGEWTDTAP